MADAQKVIELVFRGLDQTGEAVRSAINNTSSFGESIRGATQPIADFTGAAFRVEAGIVAAGAAMVGFAINAATKFEGALADLNKVLDDSDPPLAKLGAAAVDLSNKYGVASADVVASLANFRQSGFDASEALTLVNDALSLKIAGDIDAKEGSDLLVASLKGFNLEASDARTVIDLLNQTSNNYAATLPELLRGFAQLSPTAKTAGLSLQETVGILTPVIEVFRSGSVAATGLNTVLLRLTDDSKPVRDALASIGVAQTDTNGQLRSARDIYFDVAKSTQGLTEQQRLFVAQQLAGIDQAPRLLAALNGIKATSTIAGEGFNFMGSAAREVAVRLDTTQVAVSRLGTSLDNALTVIGTPLLDETRGIASAITDIFGAIAASADQSALRGLVSFVESMFQGLQDTLAKVARNLPAALDGADLSGFTRGITAVTDAIGRLFGGVDLTTVEGLRSAIETVGRAFFNFQTFIAGVIDSLRPLFTAATEAGGAINGLGGGFFDALGQLAGFASQANVLSGVVGGLGNAVTALVTVLGLNAAVGLIPALARAGSLLTVLAANPATVAIIAGTAAFAGIAGAVGDYAQASTRAELSQLSLQRSQAGLADDLGRLGRELGLTIGSFEEFEGLVRDGTIVADEQAGKWRLAKDAAGALTTAVADLSDPYAEANAAKLAGARAALTAAQAEGTLADQADAAAGALLAAARTGDPYLVSLRELGFGADAAATKTKQTKDETKALADAAERAADKASNLALEYAKLNNALSLEAIRGAAQVAVAQVEADAQALQAVFSSIDNTITSTGETLTGFFDSYASNIADLGVADQFALERIIRREEERRDEALALQKELTQATIEELRARTQALANGGSLITVDGAGLQPHLEAFMFEILRAIQVRVNQEGLEFLLGAG